MLLLLGMPRVVLVLTWIFGDGYLGRAFPGFVWPLLGFFFLPFTTLAFAYAMNSLKPVGEVPDFGWLLVVLAGLVDLGVVGGGQRARRARIQART
ncbi:MAG: hypothetical protein AAGD10_15075 [Myxococcota bacterium]